MTATLSPAYEAKKRRAAAASASQSRAGRDIGPLPPVKDPARRVEAMRSFRAFCELYLPHTFTLAWSLDHRRVIERIEAAVLRGGQFALAMPRGSGKSSLAEAAALWAILIGARDFVVLIGADEGAAVAMLDSIKTELSTNGLLLDDFPEAVFPIHKLDGIPNRAGGQLCNGVPTRIGWTADEIVLPTIAGSRASGRIIRVAGITGRIRGMKFKRPDGRSVRPDLVIPDDPQTDDSARSPSQCAQRERVLTGAVLGLAGPGKRIAAVMPCTVIEPDDLADRALDRERHPEWQGERTKMVYAWPTNAKLWEQYADIRANSLRAGNGGREATEFYAANREAMDAGSQVAWPVRHNPDELSAIQHAMNLRQDLGDPVFFAEYQNDPTRKTVGVEVLTPDEIARKGSGLGRGLVPLKAEKLTAFIDVQGKLLYWMVCAWSPLDFTGHVVEYGSYPDQKRPYFQLKDARRTIQQAHPEASTEKAQVYAALSALVEDLAARRFTREDGVEFPIERLLVDAGWQTEIVHQFCRRAGRGALLLPSMGHYVGASSKPWEQYVRREGELLGFHWRLPKVSETRLSRYVQSDINFWKTFLHERLALAIGDPGCLTLWGSDKRPEAHRGLSEHLTAEYRVRTQGHGRTVDEWKLKPGRPDNHWLDCLVGCAVAASMLGCRVQLRPVDAAGADAAPRPPAPRRPRQAVSYF
jgi:hypothetical protein